MAEAKLSPRQKMIGMMYLVLTALLALNISKEILESFIIVDSSLQHNLQLSEEKVNSVYSDFSLAEKVDPAKSAPFIKKANQAKELANSHLNLIHELKKELISKTDGISPEVADTIHPGFIKSQDNYDIPTMLLIGNSEDGKGGKAALLHKKLLDFEAQMKALLPANQQNSFKSFLKEDKNGKVEGETWENHHFFNTPLVADLALLSKFENDIKSTEFQVVNALYQAIRSNDMSFDTIAAKVVPRSNYVMQGEEYESSIFLGAFSSTQKPSILIGKLTPDGRKLLQVYDSIPAVKGIATYKLRPNKEGENSYEGMVKIRKANGEMAEFPFRSAYTVSRPMLVVSPTQMNCFYKGIPNPVSVSVPGVTPDQIQLTISGSGNSLKRTASGEYQAIISPNSPYSIEISATAKLSDGSIKPMGKLPFRVKDLPPPMAYISNISNSGKLNLGTFKAQSGIVARYDPSFAYNLTTLVHSFTYTTFTKNQFSLDKEISSNKFDNVQFQSDIKNLRRGDKVYFTKIKTRDAGGKVHTLNDITIVIQ